MQLAAGLRRDPQKGFSAPPCPLATIGGRVLSAEFIGQTCVPYKRMGKHFDLIISNNTSADVLRPIFPNSVLFLYSGNIHGRQLTSKLLTIQHVELPSVVWCVVTTNTSKLPQRAV